jgi:hypothetical protein
MLSKLIQWGYSRRQNVPPKRQKKLFSKTGVTQKYILLAKITGKTCIFCRLTVSLLSSHSILLCYIEPYKFFSLFFFLLLLLLLLLLILLPPLQALDSIVGLAPDTVLLHTLRCLAIV